MKEPTVLTVGSETLELCSAYVRLVLLISTHDGMWRHMSMVIMHMAMAIATMVELNILILDNGERVTLSNWIRRNCLGKKRCYSIFGRNEEMNRTGKLLNLSR